MNYDWAFLDSVYLSTIKYAVERSDLIPEYNKYLNQVLILIS